MLPFATLAAAVPAMAFVLGTLPAQDAPSPPSITYGALSIHAYELREARHDPAFRITAADGVVGNHRFSWQIVIRGERFPIRALDPILVVGDDVNLVHFVRHDLADGGQELVYEVVDPKLLRAERSLQVIYGRDERTRTRMLERLDPERLVKLPDAERKAAGIPDLEGLRLLTIERSGRVAGRGRLSDGVIKLAARLESGKLFVLPAKVELGADGGFDVNAGPLPATATHVVALLLPRDQGDLALGGADLNALPKGVELLDSKPVGTKIEGR